MICNDMHMHVLLMLCRDIVTCVWHGSLYLASLHTQLERNMGKVEELKQGCSNSRYLVARATKLYVVVLNICGSSVQSLLLVTQLAHRILRWLLDVWKICAPLCYSLYNK
jgi:hypothetical protein